MLKLTHPLESPPYISQAWGHRNDFEPTAYLYPDNTIGYVKAEGTQQAHFHNGVDYPVDCGTPLHAPYDGVVTYADFDPTGFGLRLDISLTGSASGLISLFGHCKQLLVPRGAIVEQGQIVAYSGNTGNSSGCHFHFSLYRKDGRFVPPDLYLKG